jgi:uncharacterized zinc-type alcohol dehydrogenase-like protein
MPIQAKGIATPGAADKLAPFDFERRDPRANDVHIEITYAGICHSDIHTARGDWGPALYPLIPGHEIVGHVKAVGDKVTKFKVGDVVGVGCMVDSCLSCEYCKGDDEQFCAEGFTGTYNSYERGTETPTFGGYSTDIVVREEFVLGVPKNLDEKAVAPLLCAGITTYSPLKRAGVGKGHTLGVVGLGGLGHMAVKIGAALGAEVTVLSRTAGKEADAARLGAKHFLITTDEAAVAKAAMSFDFILDTVSAKHDYSQLLGMLKTRGQMLVVGAPAEPIPVSAFSLLMKGRSITGSLIGGIAETQEMLDFCGQHGIVSDIELINGDYVNEAYERVMSSDVKYRFVIDIASIRK